MNYPKNTDDKKNLLDALSQLDTQELKYLWLIWSKCQDDKGEYPNWPEEVRHQTAIIHNKSWEISHATLEYCFENGSYNVIHRKALKAAAVAYRFLLTSEKRS